MNTSLAKLDFGFYFHIYNRAVGNERLFLTDEDYQYFLKKYTRYIEPITDTYAYCLLPNHFHFLIRIKNEYNIDEDLTGRLGPVRPKDLSHRFGNFFNSYTRSFNKVHKRSGKLFDLPFKRIHVDDEAYFTVLVYYIHRNPIHHDCADGFMSWKWSSYKILVNNTLTGLRREDVLLWFGGKERFIEFHEQNLEVYKEIERYWIE